MPSSPLGSTHGRTTSAVAYHHRLWAAQTVERRRRGMSSSPLCGKHGRTTSGMACQHRLYAAHTVERRRAWHAIIAFGQHTRSDGVGRGMPSSPLDDKHGQTTSGMVCHHRLWAAQTVERRWAWHDITALGQHTQLDDVERGMPSLPLGSTHGRTTLGVAFHHIPWTANAAERRRAWHEITALGLHAPSNDVGRGMTSSPLDCTHLRIMSGVA